MSTGSRDAIAAVAPAIELAAESLRRDAAMQYVGLILSLMQHHGVHLPSGFAATNDGFRYVPPSSE